MRQSNLARVAVAAVSLGVALSVALAGTAGATTTPTWSAASSIPGVSSISGATVASSPTGPTLLAANLLDGGALWSVSAGTALPTGFLAIFGQISSETIHYAPNGSAIIAGYDANNGDTTFQYRSASGTLGGSTTLYGVSSYAVNNDELLVTSAGNGASVSSYAISSTGSLTANGPAIQIFTDGTLFGETWTAIDPTGEAMVLINATDEQQGTPDYGDGYLAEVERLPSGAWQTPTQLPGNIDTNAVKVAVAPTGAMIALYPVDVETDYQFYTTGVYALIREPGGNFGSPVQLLDQSSVPLAGISGSPDPQVAAGPDGTLAVSVTSDTCPNQQQGTDESSSTTIWIAPPGGALASYGLPGSTLTSTQASTVTALAAGGGKAVVGVSTSTVTNPTNVEGGNAWDEAPCWSEEGYPSQTVSVDTATLLGPNTDIISPAFGTGGQTGTGPVTTVAIDAASVDPNGYATVIGNLNSATAAQYATLGNVGGAYTPTPATPTTPTPSTATPTTVTPAAAVAPKQTAAAIKTLTPTIIGQNWTQTVGATNTSDAIENLTIAEWAYASGLTNSLARTHAKRKLVLIATGHLTLKPHKSGKLKLHLSKRARKALAHKGHKLSVTFQLTVKSKGHSTTVIKRHLVLHRR